MGKVKIHELAKELDLTSKEIIEKATELGIEAKSHMSSIDEAEVNKIKEQFLQKSNKLQKTSKTSKGEKTIKAEKEVKEDKTVKKEDKKQSPVIIRREVIISDEEQKENNKPTESKSKQVGFVERNKNADYNIVYRNRPTKPMTVSELFGLGKKDDKTEETSKVGTKTETAKANNTDTKVATAIGTKKVEARADNKNTVAQSKDFKQDRNDFQKKDFRQDRNNFNNKDNRNDKNGNNNANYKNQSKGGYNKKPLDERGIDRNIKDIMAVDIIEKENVRDFNSRAIDKVKSERQENKKQNKGKRNSRFDDSSFDGGKLKGLKQVDRLSNMFNDQEGGMLDYYDLTTARGKRNKKKANKNQEDREQKIFQLTEISIPESITVKDLAAELKKTSAEVIKKLFGYGIMATINNEVDFDTAFLVAEEFGVTAIKKQEVKEEDILFDESEDKEEELQSRPPVVVVMGHVDHGKTSLLDAVRETNVIAGEAGGITQAIGAYKVTINGREITFLDTPGHEAFTSMRARGAQITDIAILVVAANDGVMPQTVEAINHAKAAGIPIIVAVNKIDLPEANIDKVKQELMTYDLVPEEWGGDTIYVPISAKKRMNIDELLEMVLLQADVLELKANPKKQAKGVVIEARLDKAKGPIATMLVQRGSLDTGDTIVVGSSIGRIRAMKNDKGQKVKTAGPSTPVEIMGLTEVPEAGDVFYEVKDEKMAKHLIERRKRAQREKSINNMQKVTLDNLFTQMEAGNLKHLNIIVKADVQGSSEAIKQSLEKLSNEEVNVRVIHAAAGAVAESDVTLAQVANAIIIAFNVRPVPTAKDLAERNEIEIKQYSVIYQAIDDVKAAMKGMLDPIYQEKVIGNVEVRQVFKVSNVGTIAGAYVLDGKIERNAGVRVLRDNVVIHEGKLVSLKRFKDDVKEVAKGYECGMQIEDYNDLQEGDIIEVYIMEEIKR